MKKILLIALAVLCIVGCRKKEAEYDYAGVCRQIAEAHVKDLPIDSLLNEVMFFRASLSESEQEQFDAEFTHALAEAIINESVLAMMEKIEQIGDVSAVLVSGMFEMQLSINKVLPEDYITSYSIEIYRHWLPYEMNNATNMYGLDLQPFADSIWAVSKEITEIDDAIGKRLENILEPITRQREKLNYKERRDFDNTIFPKLTLLIWERMNKSPEFAQLGEDIPYCWVARRIRVLMSNLMSSSTGFSLASYVLSPIGNEYTQEVEKYKK